MMNKKYSRVSGLLVCFVCVCGILHANFVWGQIPSALTDTIKKGNGVIDLFKDVSGSDLQEYLLGRTVFLGLT